MKGKQSAEKVNSHMNIYDVYNNDHERYLQKQQELSLKKANSNIKIETPIQFQIKAQSEDSFLRKLMKRKWWVIWAAIGGMAVGALVVGLALNYSICHDITSSAIANSTSSISITMVSKTSSLSSILSPSSTTSTTMSSTSNESSTSTSGTSKFLKL